MTRLNDEFKKLVKFLSGETLKDEDFKPSFNIEDEKLFAFIKNINDILEKFSILGSEIMQNLPKDAKINDFLEKAGEVGLKKAKEDPKMIESILDSLNILTDTLYSLEFQKELFSIPTGSSFEQLLKSIFMQELEAAEKKDKNKVAESFKIVISSVVNKPKPDQLFLMSKFQELQLPNLETDNVIDIILYILNDKKKLFELSDDRVVDVTGDFVNRLGRSIELYLKGIILSIVNLSKIKVGRRLLDFNGASAHYLNLLHINRPQTEDYLDFRNSIMHDDFEVLIDRPREAIELNFNIKRRYKGEITLSKEVIMTLEEFTLFFRGFRKFQSSFFNFFEIYIKSIEKSYKFQFMPSFDL